jgi:transketolase
LSPEALAGDLRAVAGPATDAGDSSTATAAPAAVPGSPWPLDQLPALALRVREHIVRLATGGGCFIGASLSCADLLVHLYTRILRLSPSTLADPERDYLFLSKGHDVPALYGTLAELGYIPRERLGQHLKTSDSIYWHPNRAVPGVEFHSGSLGHLLSVAVGVALDIRLRGGANRVWVILGDGELDEGSVWEACLVAAALRLDNLVAIVDRNEFQANVRTEELVPLEPIPAKFEAFGWSCRTADGHDFAALEAALAPLREAPDAPGKPSVVVARTVRGKGLPSIEARADRWFCNFTADEVQGLLAELHGGPSRGLTSETLVVR